LRVSGLARAAQSAPPLSSTADTVTTSAVLPALRSQPQPAPAVPTRLEIPAGVHAIASSAAMPAAPVRTLNVTASGIDLSSSKSAAAAASAATVMTDLADLIADILNREADLRGID
jgi:hypothetical protein